MTKKILTFSLKKKKTWIHIAVLKGEKGRPCGKWPRTTMSMYAQPKRIYYLVEKGWFAKPMHVYVFTGREVKFNKNARFTGGFLKKKTYGRRSILKVDVEKSEQPIQAYQWK